ncbi:MFS transporter small subunit [Dongia sedimenti]|uniref:Oxalate:formate antiporter n=1 Tax=Dongia sedimenti TaxID=3064282 RepID=A0ABU0YNL1_9PROT|nr:hypothetical protein [Rhodospirillaceae bacterium R-7]
MDGPDVRKDYTVQVVLAWLLVGIPLLWGVWKTLLNAMQLFQ